MERNNRTKFQGVVTSIKMDKTITVTVSTKQNDPLYQKRVGYSKKYHAHDEKNEAQVGDVVTIMSCRPISKTKKFILVSIDKKAALGANANEVEEALEQSEGSSEIVNEGAKEEEAK